MGVRGLAPGACEEAQEEKRDALQGPVIPIFRIVDTYGLPLEVAIGYLTDRGLKPDLVGFIFDAARAGWGKRTIRERLLAALADVHGPQARRDCAEKIDFVLEYLS
jgi:alanyl-tRNA synthetase